MRILIAIDNFKVGGAERVASLIANELSKENEVHVALFDDEIRYPIDPRVGLHNVSPVYAGRIFRIIKRLRNYTRLIRDLHPDIIYAFAYVSIYAAAGRLLAKQPQIRLICSERTDPSKEPRLKLMRYLRDWAYSQSDTLVCQTPQVVEFFRKKRLNVRCRVIPNPVKENLPRWIGSESRTFIVACRLAKQKNLPLLLEAFKIFIEKNPEYRLEIYGDGPEKDILTKQIRQLGLNAHVFIKPFVTNIHDLMARSLAYVSSSDYEGISNSMLEALAIGVPAICTDCPVGGANMFIKDGINGFLVAVGDKLALAENLEKIVHRQVGLQQISQQAQLIRDRISPSKIVAEWLSLIN